jgi:1-phosphofructokinase
MILTVTLNPAMDRTLYIDHLAVDRINRVKETVTVLGGKGINVSKTLLAMGAETKALLIAGEENQSIIDRQLDQLGLEHVLIPVTGETRINIKIVDEAEGTYTDCNEKGPVGEQRAFDAIRKRVREELQDGDVLVLSGSLPPGWPEEIYRALASEHGKKVQVILDGYGPSFVEGLKAKPALVKPNLKELEDHVGRKLPGRAEQIEACLELIEAGAGCVVLSLGEEGLLRVDGERVHFAKALKVDVKSTVGAGDALVGGLAYAMAAGEAPVDSLKRAVATASSVIETPGSHTGDLKQLKDYMERVDIKELKRTGEEIR